MADSDSGSNEQSGSGAKRGSRPSRAGTSRSSSSGSGSSRSGGSSLRQLPFGLVPFRLRQLPFELVPFKLRLARRSGSFPFRLRLVAFGLVPFRLRLVAFGLVPFRVLAFVRVGVVAGLQLERARAPARRAQAARVRRALRRGAVQPRRADAPEDASRPPRGARVRAGSARAGEAAESLDFSGKTVAELREAITRGVIGPLNLLMLTRDRIEEVVGDAVSRGRVTAEDAQSIVQGLVTRGREQTDSVLGDLENLLGGGAPRSPGPVGRARKQVGDATVKARKRALDAADPMIAQADRARRVAGVGPSFPILGYDDLTAAQVQSRLDGLSSARAAQGARLRAPQREPQVGARRHRSASSAEPAAGCPAQARLRSPSDCHSRGMSDGHTEQLERSGRRPAGRRARADGRVARARRCRRRAPRRLRRLRPGGGAGRPRPGDASRGRSAPSPRRARSSCSRRRPTASSRAAPHPGAPWQVLPYERQLEVKQSQVERRARAARGLRASAGRPDRPGRSPVALPQQARVLVRRRRRRRARARLPPARALERDRRHRGGRAGASGDRQRFRRARARLVPRRRA